MKLLVCLLTLSALAGCDLPGAIGEPSLVGSGVPASVQRQIGPIDQIVVEGAMDVKVTVGGEPQLKIETDDNLLPIIITKVNGTKLTVGTRQGYETSLGVKVDVRTPVLRSVI